ncbi:MULTISPECIES: fimbrial protein [unclassified Pseudomonas]|jgi:type 1 fimbria pilin|uniref:fimbrial protein n=1 Tax=Pseudomonas sp. A-R-26 TaxID=2832404 RepID=UPI001CBCA0F6|nr:fimbrial protein [Pseudomonas sp. A-R-26]
MKKHLLALSLGLSAAVAGTSVYANTGTIHFEGKIKNSTCPIEIINPEDGSVGNQVKMGSIEASRFTAVDQEYRGKSFALRVSGGPGCGLKPADNTAKVTFNGTAHADDSDYFAVTSTPDGAGGVAISLRDRSGASIAPGTSSVDYDLADTGSTDMVFNAYYRSITLPVTAGAASADVPFIVTIN